MRRIPVLVVATAALAACTRDVLPPSAPIVAAVAGSSSGGPAIDFCLTLLHNNDAESKLLQVATGPTFANYGGIARFATVVQRQRALANGSGATTPCGSTGPRGSLLVSSGDNFLAGLELNASFAGPTFYDAVGMDIIGYDASAIGNHEFDFGPELLARFVSGFTRTRPPFLSANLDVSGEPSLQALATAGRIRGTAAFAMPRRTVLSDWSTVVSVGERKVGIIGATTPRLPTISSPGRAQAREDVAGIVNAEVDRLLAAGVTRIIFISHLQSLNEDLALVPQLRGIDVIVAGGGEEILGSPSALYVPGDVPTRAYPVIATDLNGKTVRLVTTRGDYAYVGRLVVGFDAAGEIVQVGAQSGPIRVAGGSLPDAVPDHPLVKAQVTDPVAAYVAAANARVLASADVALDGRRTPVRTIETNLGNLTADALLWQAKQSASTRGAPQPDVALQNGGGIRNNSLIPAGNISEGTLFGILPFSNFVAIVPSIPRAQFKEILENAVSNVANIDGRFIHVAGFRFEWSVTGAAQTIIGNTGVVGTPGTRVRNVTLDDGTQIVVNGVVQAGPAINIATIDFLANGGDQSPYRGAAFASLGVSYLQGLQNYVTGATPSGALGGVISSVKYPGGGTGRIVRLP